MKRLRGCFFHCSVRRALMEGTLGFVPALLLAFAVIDELPASNVPATILFLVQFPLLWAALRLRLEPALTGRAVLCEAARGGGLRLASLALMAALAAAFRVQHLLVDEPLPYGLVLLLFSATWLPWMLYRLFFYGLRAWFGFTRKSLLWTLVNSYLGAVIVVVALATFSVWAANFAQPGDAVWPDDPLAAAVLELVRGILPWFAVSIVYLFAALVVVLPPALLLSYLTARHFAGRIQGLARAMHRARSGDLGVRVTPRGADEVAQLQEDFNAMAADLQSEREKVNTLLANQRELAAVISHELRTPLTVMRATLETDLAAEAQGTPAYPQDLTVLHQETLHLQALVEDLFTLSQLDSQHLDMDCAWHEPAAIVSECLTALRAVAWKSKRIDLSAVLPDGLPRVWTDPRRLTQVLTNLVQNAIRHTPSGGVIVLQAADLGAEGVELSVSDSGEGISVQDLPHIWERYYRGGDRSGGQRGRTGIGLSLVKELVEAMRGTVGAESTPGAGSRFWLRLHSEGSRS